MAARYNAASTAPAERRLPVGRPLPLPGQCPERRGEELEADERLVLRSTTHLPPWPADRWLNWVWAYALAETSDGGTRLLLRTRSELGPAVLLWAYRAMLWTDFVMARSHLLGIKRRAERTA